MAAEDEEDRGKDEGGEVGTKEEEEEREAGEAKAEDGDSAGTDEEDDRGNEEEERVAEVEGRTAIMTAVARKRWQAESISREAVEGERSEEDEGR